MATSCQFTGLLIFTPPPPPTASQLRRAAFPLGGGSLSLPKGRIITKEDLINEGSWDTVPVKSWPRVQYTVESYDSGLLLSIRVRAFSAMPKAPDPGLNPSTPASPDPGPA